MKCLVWSVSCSLAVRAGHDIRAIPTAWAVIAVVSLTYRATHTRTSLLNDQHHHPAIAVTTHPTTSRRLQLMMLITKQDTLMNPNIPANIVRNKAPAKPITFIKVLDTLFSILRQFIVETYNLCSLDSVRHQSLMPRQLDITKFDISIYCRPGYSQKQRRLRNSVVFVRLASVVQWILHLLHF